VVHQLIILEDDRLE